jgi:GNAT superfamily N-acetyltransferase
MFIHHINTSNDSFLFLSTINYLTTMEEIVIKEVKTRRDKRKFIFLPPKVHKNDPTWLPPIYMDEWELFDEKNNKSYKYADTILLLAYRGKKVVGRIMGIINRRYNTIHNEQHGRFCFLECYEDQDVVHALISHIEKWAREKGMTALVGPLGFSDKDPQGLQIEGFEHPKFIVCPTNDKYLPEMIVREGYEKHQDLVNYLAKTPDELPPIYKKILSRVSANDEYKIVEFKSKKELKPYIVPALELMNQTFEEIYGFVPLNDQEKKEFAARYITILDPKFIKVVETTDGLIGFAVGMPDISTAIMSSKGRIFPFGIFKIIRTSKNSKKLLMLLGGVRKDYRGKGIDVLMAVKLMQACIDHNIELIDLHLVLETNKAMRQECERIDAKIIKRFRIYKKELINA